mmetsp:Transcript_22523/g.39917  ORF Transcript_22523/g.39917 Transcript_22523/m.39917 type:complete len:174 (+) Transcript_22523:143-664(+)
MAGSDKSDAAAGDVVQINKDVYFGPIHTHNVEQVRRLQDAVLQVRYKESFYEQVVGLSAKGLAKLAYFKDVMVGASCCRVDEREGKEGKFLYVMTLAVLPAYRGRGIGTELINHLVKKAEELGLAGVYLHVWTKNEEGLNLYKKLGFEVGEKIESYYKRMDPPDCFVLEKTLA